MEKKENQTRGDTMAYEYYFDYIDQVSFVESELVANKYSIVIAVWVGLIAFSVFLFLILRCMTRTDQSRPKYALRRNRLQSANENLEAAEETEENQNNLKEKIRQAVQLIKVQ